MYILHQYQKASRFKVCTVMCRSEKKMGYVIYIKLIQNGCDHVFLLGGGGGASVLKEYEIITLKYNGKSWAYIYYSFVYPRI